MFFRRGRWARSGGEHEPLSSAAGPRGTLAWLARSAGRRLLSLRLRGFVSSSSSSSSQVPPVTSFFSREISSATEESEEALHPEDTPEGPQQPPVLDLTAPNFDFAQVPALGMAEMKAFLHAPTPRQSGMMLCRLKRDRHGLGGRIYPTFILESDGGVFLMSAHKMVRNKTPHYAICMSMKIASKEEDTFVGKLRADFAGTHWTAYGPGLNPARSSDARLVREELLAVQYTASAAFQSPQRMTAALPHVPPLPGAARRVCRPLCPQKEGLAALQQRAEIEGDLVDIYVNKMPRWNERKRAYVLNFNKRVTMASVKNFQLVDVSNPDVVCIQFGRVARDEFSLDFQYPLSPFQAFAACLTSFKIASPFRNVDAVPLLEGTYKIP